MIRTAMTLLGCVAMAVAAALAHGAAPSTPASSFSLADVQSLALERNPAVAGATGVVEETRGQQITSRAYPNPVLQGNTGYGVLKETGRLAPGASLESPPNSLWEYNFTLGQPVEWPLMRAARQGAAAAGVAGASAGLEETRLNLLADVSIAFYELLAAQRNQELAAENLDIVEDVQRIVNARVRLGEAPQFESIKAEVEVLKARQALRRAQNTVRVNRVVLDTLTAGALGVEFRVEGGFRRFPAALRAERLAQRAVTDHPAILRSGHLIEQADRSIEFQRQARVPTVTFNGSYVREIGREAALAGISVPTPLWYRRQGEIATALGSKRREEAGLLRVRNELLRRVNQHYQDALTTAELIDVFEKGLLKQSKEALRIAEFSFRQGAASLLEVLDAQRVQRQILVDYTQAQFELSVSLANLERAVGGAL